MRYLEVIKPLPSLLLAFLGVAAAIIAAEGAVNATTGLVAITVLIAAAGANGITNYLDRDLDAMMGRTRHRALACGRISPPQKALPLILGLIVAGLILAWFLHPLALVADAAGTLAAALWRKRITCVYPQGMIASWTPLLMGWFAVRTSLSWELGLLCVMVSLWLPLHVWSVIIANRGDYLQAGLTFFPVNTEEKDSVKVLLVFALMLFAAAAALYFVGGYAWFYLVAGAILGLLMITASSRLVATRGRSDAWKLYKLSSFPYLGLLFLSILVDTWLLG